MGTNTAVVQSESPRSEQGWFIVLDPGHGGVDRSTCVSQGACESDLALDIARRTQVVIKRDCPTCQVFLTREHDEFVPLEMRPQLANRLNADVFVSIHLNASPIRSDQGGVTTFILDTGDPNKTRPIILKDHGLSSHHTQGRVDHDILSSLLRTEQVSASLTLAEYIQNSTVLSAQSLLPQIKNRGVKRSRFAVLSGVLMPAVLIEASFLTAKSEADALLSQSYRDRIAQGICSGILQWFHATDHHTPLGKSAPPPLHRIAPRP